MRFGMSSARITVGLAVALAVLGCSGPVESVVAQEAAQPQAPPTKVGAVPDFDGDGTADLVYGVGTTRSYVAVSYGSGRAQTITRTDVGGTDPASDDNIMGFGQGLLARDLNGDAYTDLVVVDASQGAGSAIYLAFGSADGLRPAQAKRYPVPAGMYGFHGAPALLESPGRLLVVPVWVPANVAKGGAVLAYQLGVDGLPGGAPKVLSQKNLPGTDEPGDGFGAAIAASKNLLLIGSPGEDVGKTKDAGAVTVLRYLGEGRFSGSVITQNSKGVPGKAAKGDRFGTAVAIADGYAAVGVPAKDGVKRDSGAVVTFKVSGGKLKPLAMITQDSAKVPGKSEINDRFGSAVAVIRACKGGAGLLVGTSREAIGTAADAGSVWVLPLAKACKQRVQLYEGHGLGGAATEMAAVGAAVSTLRTSASGADTLVFTAPGNSEEGVYGRVFTQAPPYTGNAVTVVKDLILNEEGIIALSPPAG